MKEVVKRSSQGHTADRLELRSFIPPFGSNSGLAT